MKRKDWLLAILACFVLAGALIGLYQYRSANTPQPQTAETPEPQAKKGEPAVTLRVTREFGAVRMTEKSIPVQAGDTVIDVLKRSGLPLKTGYNGGFVESIDGVASEYQPGNPASKKRDWFFYVNGQMADVGAAEFAVYAGDIVWWDFHSWEYAISTPSMIGAYPHPFRVREGEKPAWPLVVMAGKGFEEQAEQVADALQKVRGERVNVVSWNESQWTKENGLVVVGDTAALLASPFVQELWKAKQMQGLFVELNQQGVVAVSDQGKPAGQYNRPGTGLLLATMHPQTRMPVWIVSGTDADGVSKIAQSLTTTGEPAPFDSYAGAVWADGKWVRLPAVDAAEDKQ